MAWGGTGGGFPTACIGGRGGDHLSTESGHVGGSHADGAVALSVLGASHLLAVGLPDVNPS